MCSEYSNDNSGECTLCTDSLIPNTPNNKFCVEKVENCIEYTNDNSG